MFRKILVPLDGSELAELALEPALRIVQQAEGELVLLSVSALRPVYAVDHGGYGTILSEEALEASREELEHYLEKVHKEKVGSRCATRLLVLEGDEASTIVDTAESEGAELIIMSTHGRTGFTRWMLGSVTEKVLRVAPCPVLVVRSSTTFDRAVITLDGSKLSEFVLEPGLEVAKSLGCDVTLLKVSRPVALRTDEITRLESIEKGLGTYYKENVIAGDETYLKSLAARSRARLGRRIQTSTSEGPVAQCILAFAKHLDAHLIVMATHGRSGLRRWVYGSITEKVLRTADCAMLVVRPPLEEMN